MRLYGLRGDEGKGFAVDLTLSGFRPVYDVGFAVGSLDNVFKGFFIAELRMDGTWLGRVMGDGRALRFPEGLLEGFNIGKLDGRRVG
jgi:hypothetical protein